MGHTETPWKRKILMGISLTGNLGLLGFFKYYNFFVDSFIEGFTFLGMPFEARTLNIILPVGISFYTFQTLSYTLDIYRKTFSPTRNLVAFLSYVTFFPQLVAGPIERASHLLPQFLKQRSFDLAKARDGMRQILWGLFKKVVIADSVAHVVDTVVSDPSAYSGSELAVAMVFFAIQVYCDFSGYSDIAIGTARLLGFSLMRNFAFPFFSRDWAELWRRWHISLTTWFRDYVYYPMGGSRSATLSRRIFNVLIVFLISGFWHGADWNYIFWGLTCGLIFIPLMLTHRNRQYLDTVAQGKWLPSFKELLQMSVTFGLFVFTLIFFRTDNLM
jgi:D-alanyl-lipoteichoic acid acyltransferase DltB (MBOAT superfamily)